MNLISGPLSMQIRKSKNSLVVTIALAMVFSSVTATSFAASPSAKPKVSAKPTAKATAKTIAKPTAMPSPGADGPGDGGPRGGGFGGAFANLSDADKSCLAKNGFTVPQGGANRVRPTGMPSGAPSGAPMGVRPTGMPSGAPSGGARMGGGRGAGFDPTAITKAFSACGIQAPAFGGQGSGPAGAAPSQSGKAAVPAKPTTAAVSSKQTAFVKCMTSAGIKAAGAALAYDQSDPDTAIALVKCQKSTGFAMPKKK